MIIINNNCSWIEAAGVAVVGALWTGSPTSPDIPSPDIFPASFFAGVGHSHPSRCYSDDIHILCQYSLSISKRSATILDDDYMRFIVTSFFFLLANF